MASSPLPGARLGSMGEAKDKEAVPGTGNTCPRGLPPALPPPKGGPGLIHRFCLNTLTLLSGNTYTQPAPWDWPDPPSHMCCWARTQHTQKQLPVHTPSHPHTGAHNLNTPGFSQSQTSMSLFPSTTRSSNSATCAPSLCPAHPNSPPHVHAASPSARSSVQPLAQPPCHCSWTSLTLPSPRDLAEEEVVGSHNCQGGKLRPSVPGLPIKYAGSGPTVATIPWPLHFSCPAAMICPRSEDT